MDGQIVEPHPWSSRYVDDCCCWWKNNSFHNVLVGEVWLASGQSNMEFKLKRSFEAQQDIANASNPNIRFLDVPNTKLDSPTNNIKGTWTECTPETAEKISAVAYYFARALQKERGVPIGIIESDWGGSPAEAWTPWPTLAASPTLKAHYIDEYMQGGDPAPTNLGKPRKGWRPGELYNGMIAPLEPFAFAALFGIKANPTRTARRQRNIVSCLRR